MIDGCHETLGFSNDVGRRRLSSSCNRPQGMREACSFDGSADIPALRRVSHCAQQIRWTVSVPGGKHSDMN